MNILRFIEEFSDEESCESDFQNNREKEGVFCTKCGCSDHYWFQNMWQ